MYNPHDTICAISTPPGESALAIVRLSGKNSKQIVEQLFKGAKLKNRKAEFGIIADSAGNNIDEVVAVWYKAPHSYTSEEMVEITCHGGYVVSQEILSLLCRMEARLAQPGEFTLRAYLNGRIDLTEAEAINSIIRAKSAKSKSIAFYNLEGKLKTRLEKIDNELFELITLLEAQIDFSDDEISKQEISITRKKIEEILENLNRVKSTYDLGRISEGRAQIAIVGAPNVGKSSLFNALLESDRAIVTSVPGTTRDYLSEYVSIDGYPVILTDTAGVRSSGDAVEIIGIDRTKELIDKVDLCIFILDASRKTDSDDNRIAEILENRNHITVLNKIDLADKQKLDIASYSAKQKPLHISALTKEGTPELVAEINKLLLEKIPDKYDGVLLSERQFNCAQKASDELKNAITAIDKNEHDEIIVTVLREAHEHICELTGKITGEDILNNIFSKFCIGK